MGMLLDDDTLDLLTAEAIDIVLGPDPTISRVVAASEFDYIVARFGVIVLYGLQVLPAPKGIPSLRLFGHPLLRGGGVESQLGMTKE
jgi:hypothetical protein